MNSMKFVIPLHWLYWSIHTKDESKRGTAFAFIFGVSWLWRCGVTASFGVFFHEIKCNRMTSFTEFMWEAGGEAGSGARGRNQVAAFSYMDGGQISIQRGQRAHERWASPVLRTMRTSRVLRRWPSSGRPRHLMGLTNWPLLVTSTQSPLITKVGNSV